MRILFAFMVLIIGFFFFLFLVSAGVMMSVLGRLFGRRKPQPDMATVQQLGNLAPNEAQLVSDALRNGGAVTNLSDQAGIDSLLAKGIIVQTADASGIIDYRIDDKILSYLKSGR